MNFIKKKYFNYIYYLIAIRSINVIFIIFLISWLFEWLFFFDYILNFSTSMYIYFPNKIPLFLLVCFVFWVYVWGVSVWRRTQFGRFTRGDRKLWLKGFASFWIVEVVTLTGLLLVSCWMSWGPIAIISRHFWFPKKGFLFELTLFTYIMWLVYLMRFSLKWQLWRSQFFITLIIIIILFALVWRDLITLMFREVVNMDTGTNWRYRKSSNIVYSISSMWWIECYLGHFYRDNFSYYSPLEYILGNLYNHTYLHPFKFENVQNLKEFDSYQWLSWNLQSDWWSKIGMVLFTNNNLINPRHLYLISDPMNCMFPTSYTSSNVDLSNSIISTANEYTNYSGFFYPRRIGFLPKRIAMWYFLVIIKMWHHFMLFIWWFFYLLRLYNRQKSSYTMLSACYFNLYCCYIIGFLVYLYHVLPFLARMLKIKTQNILSIFNIDIHMYRILEYVCMALISDLIFHSDHISLKEMMYMEVIKSTIRAKRIGTFYPFRHHLSSYLNCVSDFMWTHSFTRTLVDKRLAVVFSDILGVQRIGKDFFDATIDIYGYNRFCLHTPNITDARLAFLNSLRRNYFINTYNISYSL